MASKKKPKKIDLTTDAGMTDSLNMTWVDYEESDNKVRASMRAQLIGRGISIRNLRLREEQQKRSSGRRAKR